MGLVDQKIDRQLGIDRLLPHMKDNEAAICVLAMNGMELMDIDRHFEWGYRRSYHIIKNMVARLKRKGII